MTQPTAPPSRPGRRRTPRLRPTVLLGLTALAAASGGGCGGQGRANVTARGPAVGTSTGDAAALYMELTNDSTADDRLTSAWCDCARETSLHLTEDLDGVLMMTTTDSILLPADSTTELRPGGSHIMLEGLREPLEAGTTVQVRVRFQRSDPIDLEVPVVALETLNERAPEP